MLVASSILLGGSTVYLALTLWPDARHSTDTLRTDEAALIATERRDGERRRSIAAGELYLQARRAIAALRAHESDPALGAYMTKHIERIRALLSGQSVPVESAVSVPSLDDLVAQLESGTAEERRATAERLADELAASISCLFRSCDLVNVAPLFLLRLRAAIAD